MAGKTSITINGRSYDPATGLAIPVSQPTQTPKKQLMQDIAPSTPQLPQATIQRSKAAAADIHAPVDRSRTLYRAALKKPGSAMAPVKERARVHMTRSEHITKFARQVATPPIAKNQTTGDESVEKPVLQRTFVRHTAAPAPAINSHSLKEHLIKEHLDEAPLQHAPLEKRFFAKHPRVRTIASAAAAIVLFAGYLTYINIPNISVRVAAAQAGINAQMPEYQPDGYRFDGPPQYAQGQVTMRYASNTSAQGYSIMQKASDWDSQAVLDNYVLKNAGNNYSIHSIQGLTVYTFKNKAAWVSGGMFNEIDYGESPLSFQQIENIAASM